MAKKIGLFHTMPSDSFLQRSYLYFDEIHTSKEFLKSTINNVDETDFLRINKKPPKYIFNKIDFLSELGVLNLREDIENRVLPITGAFDYDSIAKLIKEADVKNDKSLIDYFNALKLLNDRYGIEVFGEQKKETFTDSRANDFILMSIVCLGRYKDSGISNESNIGKRGLNLNKIKAKDFLFGAEIYSRVASNLLNSYFGDNQYCPLISSNTYGGNNFRKFKTKKIELIN